MRRFSFIAALAMLVSLVFAPAALAQDDDLNCDDFATAADATAAMRPGDPDNLDANDNGIACEDSLPAGGTDTSTTSPTASQTATPTATPTASPTASPTGTATALPPTGGLSSAGFGIGAAAVLLATGLAAGALVRRT